jgi:ribulose 1,5-bisphosphate synthetase/thiazole synthase
MSKTKFFLLLLLFVIADVLALDQLQFHEYCIIGAGPAGLQLAYFLQTAKRDYIIYEKSSQAGK